MPAFLVTNAGRNSLAAMAGAGIIAGLTITALGWQGLGVWLMCWLPLPIVMGVIGRIAA